MSGNVFETGFFFPGRQ